MIRLLTLSIRNFRGVKTLDLAIKGRNASFVGPNGSGKSSVVDALDFLFTGGIRRLAGEGAGDLSLQKHGPHVDADPSVATVEATFAVQDKPEPVRLKRCVATPGQLESDGPLPTLLSEFLRSAQEGGHHLLTRRELLRFIFTEPSSRGKQVAALLQLTSIDALRVEIQGAAREMTDTVSRATGVEKTRGESILRSFAPAASDLQDALGKANANRRILSGLPLLDLDDPTKVRSGLTPPASAGSHPLQGQRSRELLGQVVGWCSSEAQSFSSRTSGYRQAVSELRVDFATIKSLQAAELLRRGIALLGGDECPLCLKHWDVEDLRTLLSQRLEQSREAERRLQDLTRRREQLVARLEAFRAISRSLSEALESEASLPRSSISKAAVLTAADISALLPPPLEGDLPSVEAAEGVARMVSGTDLAEEVLQLQEVASGLPNLTGIQKAWDELSAFETSLKEQITARRQAAQYAEAEKALAAADAAFVRARDEVLNSTYSSISERLKDLYAKIHRHDETTFAAALEPTKAGLRLEVSFYDRGKYPPSALHSEGHQDSMGLCLFLALAEYLAKGPMSVIILDDVLMSIDHRHRRGVAELLRDQFGASQILITTHDRVWSRQLRTVGVIHGANSFEFTGWSLTDGPHTASNPAELLRQAREALDANKIPQSAHALRRAIEEHFPEICHQLGAPVRFRSDEGYEAGEFISAAVGKYNKAFGKARAAAQSWKDESIDWGELAAARSEALGRFQTENWAVNTAIHYNEWADDLTQEDFRPVLEAYEKLFRTFTCDSCGAFVRIVEEKKDETALRCNCGQVNWNLQEKGD